MFGLHAALMKDTLWGATKDELDFDLLMSGAGINELNSRFVMSGVGINELNLNLLAADVLRVEAWIEAENYDFFLN